MTETALVFRGIDADECSVFIREIHSLAREQGRIRDFTWMADLATPAFVGPALVWFDRQSLETQADWALLRRALLEKYCDNQLPYRPDRIPSASSAAIATSPAAMPVPIVSPSPRLDLIIGSDQPRFHVRVVAPAYSGYIAKVLLSTGATSTSESGAAQKWAEIYERIDEFAARPAPLYTSNTVKGSMRELMVVRKSRGHPNGGLCSQLTWARFDESSNALRYASDGVGCHWDDMCRWTINHDGRILPNGNGNHKIVIVKSQNGSLALNLWTQRVWDDDDDVYVARLYLVRAI